MDFRKTETGMLLDLLIMAVLADKRVYADEIQALIMSALCLQEKHVFEEPISGARALLWFELNKDRLRTQMETSNFEAWLYACLDQLKDVPNKIAILEALRTVALADCELHVSEKALMVLTANHWNLPLD